MQRHLEKVEEDIRRLEGELMREHEQIVQEAMERGEVVPLEVVVAQSAYGDLSARLETLEKMRDQIRQQVERCGTTSSTGSFSSTTAISAPSSGTPSLPSLRTTGTNTPEPGTGGPD